MATLESDVEFILKGEGAILSNQRVQANADNIRWLQKEFLISADKAEKALRDSGDNPMAAAKLLIRMEPTLIRRSVI